MRNGLALLGMGVALTSASSWAAVVHINNLPNGLPSGFDKDTSAYFYFEGEKDTNYLNAVDSFADPRDTTRTMFPSSTNPTSNWSSQAVYDGARYMSYGSSTLNGSNISAYYENVTGVTAGTYDLFIRAYPNAASGASETFSFYAGADVAATNSAASLASVVVTDYSAARWHTLGRVELTAGLDTFRLRTDTTLSNARWDTLLMVPVPEPTMGAAIALFAGALLMRRR